MNDNETSTSPSVVVNYVERKHTRPEDVPTRDIAVEAARARNGGIADVLEIDLRTWETQALKRSVTVGGKHRCTK